MSNWFSTHRVESGFELVLHWQTALSQSWHPIGQSILQGHPLSHLANCWIHTEMQSESKHASWQTLARAMHSVWHSTFNEMSLKIPSLELSSSHLDLYISKENYFLLTDTQVPLWSYSRMMSSSLGTDKPDKGNHWDSQTDMDMNLCFGRTPANIYQCKESHQVNRYQCTHNKHLYNICHTRLDQVHLQHYDIGKKYFCNWNNRSDTPFDTDSKLYTPPTHCHIRLCKIYHLRTLPYNRLIHCHSNQDIRVPVQGPWMQNISPRF